MEDWSCTSGLSTGTISEKTIFNLSDNPLFSRKCDNFF